MNKPLTILLSVGLFVGVLVVAFMSGGLLRAKTPVSHGSSSSVHPTTLSTRIKDKMYYKDKVVVLMYHDISEKPLNDKSLTVDRFEEQLRLMKEEGFHWITMETYVNFELHGGKIPDNAVLLTFDDGYESFYQNAYPLLKKYGAPGTEFLIVSTVDNPKAIGIPKLTWAQVQEMHANGISFYNHTYNSHIEDPIAANGKHLRGMLAHPIYTKINGVKRVETEQEYLARITKDLSMANDILAQKLGNTLKVIAFPYGDFSKDLLTVCHKLGMDVTFTVKRGINGPTDRNGFRVNAGGMSDDPTALLADMEAGIPKPVTKDCLSWGAASKQKASNGQKLKSCQWGTLGPVIP